MWNSTVPLSRRPRGWTSWETEPTGDPLVPYVLRNSSRTVFTLAPRVRQTDVASMLVQMEMMAVPFSYAVGVREVSLSLINRDGWYLDGFIRLHAGARLGFGWGFTAALAQNLVHELGHHVDAAEALSDDPAVIKELRTHGKWMPDSYARKNVDEYVAVGFEVFYCGSPAQVKTMRERNRHLYRHIRRIHRQGLRRDRRAT